jgi:hypothetical protein
MFMINEYRNVVKMINKSLKVNITNRHLNQAILSSGVVLWSYSALPWDLLKKSSCQRHC